MKKFINKYWYTFTHVLLDLCMAMSGIVYGAKSDYPVVWYICAACWLFLAGGWCYVAIRKNRQGK